MRRSVLLVEDDLAIVEALSEALSEEGYHVDVAADGQEAFERLARQPLPDVILLDLMMSGVDGYEFRRRQLQDPRVAGVPTFILTAGAIDPARAGLVSGWLRKPVSLDLILRLLDRQCGGRAPASDHAVCFYERDAALVERISDYLAAGLMEGESAVAVASASHREGLCAALDRRNLDPAALERRGHLRLLDAAETLASLRVQGVPDEAKFQTIIGGAIDRLTAASPRGRVRAYGEMVNLLWQAGDVASALHLESLWNDLGRAKRFSLLCAYLSQGAPADPRRHGGVLGHHAARV